ncbi:hypothetical protein OESDEN_23703 [Oesophagostomum dentatum]|uniref:Uncharacterized protein n=1 Tax=Oesophagostomum dentatum TaxID=61180 RepID=A0A0B1RZN1_OESDE|nr:hypothetical protein OESDEN_23703 [Oesophagostomum dentatum]
MGSNVCYCHRHGMHLLSVHRSHHSDLACKPQTRTKDWSYGSGNYGLWRTSWSNLLWFGDDIGQRCNSGKRYAGVDNGRSDSGNRILPGEAVVHFLLKVSLK